MITPVARFDGVGDGSRRPGMVDRVVASVPLLIGVCSTAGPGGDADRRAGTAGVPPEILAAAPADPWTDAPRDFTAPDVAVDTPSRAAAAELLGAGGAVLDVGCGGVPPRSRSTGSRL